jgi:hypothetical protein
LITSQANPSLRDDTLANSFKTCTLMMLFLSSKDSAADCLESPRANA